MASGCGRQTQREGRIMHSSSALREISASIQAPAKAVRKGTRFPFIQKHADELGVSRPHLWQVLTGKRSSPELLSSYTRLLISEGRPIPADLGKAA